MSGRTPSHSRSSYTPLPAVPLAGWGPRGSGVPSRLGGRPGGASRRQGPEAPRAPCGVVGLQQASKLVQGGKRLPAVAPEAEQLGRPLLEAVRGFGGSRVALQDGVEVRAAEAEGADPGKAGPGGRKPRPRLLVEEEGARLRVPGG